MIMADRGWTCASWLGRKGVRLITPQFLHGKKQMDIPPELVERFYIARVRIRVERCLGRIKQRQFLRQAVSLTYFLGVFAAIDRGGVKCKSIL